MNPLLPGNWLALLERYVVSSRSRPGFKAHLLLLLVLCLQVKAVVYGQRISISGKGLSAQEIFQQIRQQGGYQVMYAPELLKNINAIDINVTDASVNSVLDHCLKNTGLVYVITHNTIVIRKADTPAASPGTVSRRFAVTGKVTDERGNTLEQVSITEKGTTNGTYSGPAGEFKLTVKTDSAILVFRYLGYLPDEIPVNGRSFISVQLKSTALNIDSFVVTGFNTRLKKISVVGAVTTINPKELSTPSSTLSSSFAGRLAGVIATQPSGEPGTGAQFWIRGVSTYGGTGALIFLNGIEISSRDLNSIDPANIEV